MGTVIPANTSVSILPHAQLHTKSFASKDSGTSGNVIMTTGAVTERDPNSNKTATLDVVKSTHVLGAVVLEKEASFYRPRHIEYNFKRNGFVDLFKFYTSSGKVVPMAPIGEVPGDIHVGNTSRPFYEAYRELSKLASKISKAAKRTVSLHDFFDGRSISHHEKDNRFTQMKRMRNNELNVEKEIIESAEWIRDLLQSDKSLQIVFPSSNHPNWLARWLRDPKEKAFEDPVNSEYAFDLMAQVIRLQKQLEEKEPKLAKKENREERDVDVSVFEVALRDALNNRIDKPLTQEDHQRLIFLKGNEGYPLGDKKVEVGYHGDMGVNGAKGSLRSFQQIFGSMVFGHTHTMARNNGIVNVGTGTRLILNYNKDGFSSWVQGLAFIYPDGEIQVHIFRDGRFQRERRLTPEELTKNQVQLLTDY